MFKILDKLKNTPTYVGILIFTIIFLCSFSTYYVMKSNRLEKNRDDLLQNPPVVFSSDVSSQLSSSKPSSSSLAESNSSKTEKESKQSELSSSKEVQTSTSSFDPVYIPSISSYPSSSNISSSENSSSNSNENSELNQCYIEYYKLSNTITDNIKRKNEIYDYNLANHIIDMKEVFRLGEIIQKDEYELKMLVDKIEKLLKTK